MIDLAAFAGAVGSDGPVTIAGQSTRGGAVPGVRCVAAPAGIEWVQPDEMVACCGAGTPVDELAAALAAQGQRVGLPAGGTVGGALATGGMSVRDVLLQTRYVSAAGDIVKAGGPTVKNVSGFDLCRLLVGSRGTLGFLGEVILRTQPLPAAARWFTTPTADPWPLFQRLYRPARVLWDGERLWALLEGHPADVAEQGAGLQIAEGPPPLPRYQRVAIAPADLRAIDRPFVAELGTGVVHVDRAVPADTANSALIARIKAAFDPSGRLNPGR